MLARAIVDAKCLEPEKLRQAILSVKATRALRASPISTRTVDGLHGDNVVKNNRRRGVRPAHRFRRSTRTVAIEWSRSPDDALEPGYQSA